MARKDTRYKVRSEFTGSPNGPRLVLRFCGDFIGSADDTAAGAYVIDAMRQAHNAARTANCESASTIRDEFNAVATATRAYLATGLWTTTTYDSEESLDTKYGIDDINDDTVLMALNNVCDFIRANAKDIAVYIATRICADASSAWEALGHDLLLTRNGHGAGFMDRYEVSEATRRNLDKAASALPSFDLYETDEGSVSA